MSRSSVVEPPAAARRKPSWTELADRLPIRREAWFAVGAAILLLVFYLTTLRAPGFLVWVNYTSGFAGTLLIGFFIANLIPVGERGRWGLAIGFAVTMVGMWSQYDHYQDRWANDEGDRYADWTHRWTGKVAHRTLSLKNHVQSAMMGPMSGEPERPHGRWREFSTRPNQHPRDVWFWYGKRISQGEWESRNRH